MTIFIFVSVYLIIASLFYRNVLSSRNYWIFILITYIPFFIVNFLLTSPPIVWYNPEAIWGIRLTTIPLEDFFYSFSLLSFYLIAYKTFAVIWEKKRKLE
jgi:lycopene cyclase domain-containing protein